MLVLVRLRSWLCLDSSFSLRVNGFLCVFVIVVLCANGSFEKGVRPTHNPHLVCVQCLSVCVVSLECVCLFRLNLSLSLKGEAC